MDNGQGTRDISDIRDERDNRDKDQMDLGQILSIVQSQLGPLRRLCPFPRP
jgi:hypothetical protein